MSNTAKKAETVTANAAANINKAGDMFKDYVSAFTAAGRIALEGTIEVDKLILNKFSDAAKETADYGKSLMGARDVKTVAAMVTSFAEDRLNKNVADTKEVLDLAKTRAVAVIEPFKAYAA